MPGSDRTGPIDTIGFDGAITMTSAAVSASIAAPVGAASPAKWTPRTGTPWRSRTK